MKNRELMLPLGSAVRVESTPTGLRVRWSEPADAIRTAVRPVGLRGFGWQIVCLSCGCEIGYLCEREYMAAGGYDAQLATAVEHHAPHCRGLEV